MIKDVSIIPGCIACKSCESICPNIFKVNWKSMVINKNYKENIEKIIKARDMCPVQVIKVDLEAWANIETKPEIWKLISKKYLTPDTLELIIETKNFSFEPWQYVSLKMKDKIWNFIRSYSIATWSENNFTLTVKILEKWRWWEYLTKLKEWKKIEYFGPVWHFILQKTNKNKVFIATGTWLAPMIAMLENTPKEIKKTVIFWARFEKDIYYKEVLEKFENTKIIISVSKPSENYKWLTWRVTDYLDEIWENDEVYICWNPDMVESVKEWLSKKLFPEENVFFESFVASPKVEKVNIFKDIIVNWNFKFIKPLNWAFIILWFLTPFLIMKWPMWYYDFSWDLAWWSVFFVMAIRPLADLFPNLLIFRRFVVFRNWLWILSSAIILTHFWLNFYNYYTNFGTTFLEYMWNYFTISKWSWINIFPRLTEITALLLFVTSNNISQKLFWVWWKRIQKLAYVYFLAWWIYIYSFGKNEALYSMIVVVILYLAALIKNKFKK